MASMNSTSRRSLVGFLLLAIAATSFYAALAPAASKKPKTQLVGRQSASDGGAGANKGAFHPDISATGRFAVFASNASNLSSKADPSHSDVFVYDRKLKKTTLVSREGGAGGSGGDGYSDDASISADGRFIAFTTIANNFGGPLDIDYSNIYVYDRKNKTTKLVSRRSGNGGGANNYSYDPVISGNGRYVQFSTDASNLGGPTISESNVYVRDLKTKKTILISRRSGNAGAGGNLFSGSGGVDYSGRFHAFRSDATNLGGPTDSSDPSNIYRYDLKKKKTKLISRKSGSGAGANGKSSDAKISADGNVVVYETEADNLGGQINNSPPSEKNVYVYNVKTKQTKLASRRSGSGSGADGDSADPEISGDGRYVVFETDAKNLGDGVDPTSQENVYRYDIKGKKVELIGRGSGKNGTPCSDYCESPYISATGKVTIFESDIDDFGGPIGPIGHYVYVRVIP